MNKKVNIKIFTIIASIIMLFSVCTNTYAGENFSATMTLTSNSELCQGENVTVKANISNINAGAGINVITARIDYDEEVFESLSSSNFYSSSGWSISYSNKSKKLVAMNTEKVTQNENVFSVSLRTKSSINVNSATITLYDIEVSGGILSNGGTGDVPVDSCSTTLNRAKENYSAIMTLSSNKTVLEGEVVTVSADISNINAGAGINTITAKLNYDEDIFEAVEGSNFESSYWNISYSNRTKKLIALRNSKTLNDQNVFIIKLRAKKGLEMSSTTISLYDITASGGIITNGGTGDIYINGTSTSLNLVKKVNLIANNEVKLINTDENIYSINLNNITTIKEKKNDILNNTKNIIETIKNLKNDSEKIEKIEELGKIASIGVIEHIGDENKTVNSIAINKIESKEIGIQKPYTAITVITIISALSIGGALYGKHLLKIKNK